MREPFALEKAYRQGFTSSMVDLSSTSPPALSVGEILGDCEALSSLPLAYEPGGGGQQLRASVASLYNGLEPDDVLVTAGALEAIRAVAMSLVTPGQAVLVQHPAYSAIRQAVVDAGGVVEEWVPRNDHCFDISDLCAGYALPSIGFFNSPHGPSGAVVHGLQAFPGIAIVDEVYRPIELVPGLRHRSVLDVSDRAVVIGDLSKPLGLGGLRIGWIASRDKTVLARCADMLDYLSGSVSVLSAHVAHAAISRFDALLAPRLEMARNKVATLASFVETHSNRLDWTPPQAGFTAFLRLRCGAPPPSLFKNLQDAGIFLLDGSVFGRPDYLRIALGLDAGSFARGLNALAGELEKLPATSCSPPIAGDTIVFTKAPLPGFAKTRLARGIGAEAATALAGSFLRATLLTASRHADKLFIAVEPFDGTIGRLVPFEAVEVYGQASGDLGDRLESAFAEAFARGASKPVLIGSDSPTLPGHLLDVAHRALESHDIVLGPTTDGGYYAVGMKRPRPEIFQSIDWSGPDVLRQTIARIEAAGLKAFYLPVWYDVDLAEDLPRLKDDPFISAEAAAILARTEGC